MVTTAPVTVPVPCVLWFVGSGDRNWSPYSQRIRQAPKHPGPDVQGEEGANMDFVVRWTWVHTWLCH